MAVQATTKDCSALSDAEVAEMADLCESAGLRWSVGDLSKEAEAWVLVSQVRRSENLVGFVMSTLERIGGTPAVVMGAAMVEQSATRHQVLKALVDQQCHKALMAFPDEDVVMAGRFTEPGALDVLHDLSEVRPWPEVRPNGEDRAWGRRLAKRYRTATFDDRSMVATPDDHLALTFEYSSLNGAEAAPCFADCATDEGGFVVGWGWAMAEYLEGFSRV